MFRFSIWKASKPQSVQHNEAGRYQVENLAECHDSKPHTDIEEIREIEFKELDSVPYKPIVLIQTL